MKPLRMIGLLLVLLALGVPYVLSAHGNMLSSCFTVGGAFITNLVDKTTEKGEVTGDLKGVVRGRILTSEPGVDKSLNLTLEHVITTDSGDEITTSDWAMLTPITDNTFYWRQSQTITNGTGQYATMSGTLDEIGVVDMTTGEGVLRYNGKLCSK